MQEENFCGLTKQNVQLPEAAEQGDNIGIYRSGLLESSLRSVGRGCIEGCLPPSPTQSCFLSQASRVDSDRKRGPLSFLKLEEVSSFMICMK